MLGIDPYVMQSILKALYGAQQSPAFHDVLVNSPYPAQTQPMTVPTVPYANALPQGLVKRGNMQAPQNRDDTVSAEFVNNGYHLETLLSKLINGQSLTDQQAIGRYRKTGQHLGQFETPDAAQSYAQGFGFGR